MTIQDPAAASARQATPRSRLDRWFRVARPRRRPGFQPGAEMLEGRTLLSGSTITAQRGIVTIRAEGRDVAAVAAKQGGQVIIQVADGGSTLVERHFAAGKVRMLRFLGGEGDNGFLNATTMRSVAHGGSGTNVFLATSGGNRFYGGSGTDLFLVLGNGNRLYGNGGSNLLAASGQGNRIRGGSGDDLIVASGGFNRLSGGRGTNLLIARGGRNHLRGGPDVSYLVGSPREDFFLARRANSTTIDIRALNQTPPPPPVVETPAQPPVVETPAQPPVIKAPAQPPVIDLPVNVSDLFRTTAINPTTNLAGTVNRPGSQNVFNSPLGRTNFNNAVSRLINPSVTGDRASWGINRNPFV